MDQVGWLWRSDEFYDEIELIEYDNFWDIVDRSSSFGEEKT